MAKKTVHLIDVIREVNEKNRMSTCSADVRNGWNDLLEGLLMRADVYAGFKCLTEKDVPAGHLPGMEDGKDGHKVFPDESRKHYYTHKKLR